MSISSTTTRDIDEPHLTSHRSSEKRLRSRLLNSWELYLILLVATLLRVYAADKAPFDEDQAGLLRLARDAFAHGLWPASSNISSQTILHGPIITYFLMLTAFFTDNPLGGTLTTGFFNVIGILVTYLFARRYYGRLAGGLAAALYAITTGTLVYNRFIWQPNLVPPMIILLMFALFWGGVERRKGWLIPAVALLGILYETHESGLVMALPFVVALLLATPKTIRWQDVVLAGLALCLIFLPYLEWLRVSHFVDLSVLQSVASYPPQIDTQIYNTYTAFMSPYIQSPSNLIDVLPDHPQSLLSGPVVLMLPIRYLLQVIHVTSPILALGGGLVL
ncbi:MAG: glycosyltransferase family 39 protein, partial [Ktedonobacteraceae bacterium]|nr:glycosyltransferase family 39 protein [Ktedonobacteraceae bacterium]